MIQIFPQSNTLFVVGRHEGGCYLIAAINSLPNADTIHVLLDFGLDFEFIKLIDLSALILYKPPLM